MSTRAAMRPKAAPSGTRNVVTKGHSSRMAKGRNAQDRAAANKAKVVAINQAAKVETERGARLTAARREEKALKEWAKRPAAKRGPKPATPNYDAVNASFEAKKRGEKMGTTKVKGERTVRKLEGDALATAKKAYDLRMHKQQSFSDIAEALGFAKPQLARRACLTYARQFNMADPVARRSAKSAERFMTAQGQKFDPKKFTPATPVKKATKPKAAKKTEPKKPVPPKPKGTVKKQTPGAKARATSSSARAKANVTPIPKKASASAKKTAAKRTLKRSA